jgi:nicotinamidase-related amidase
MTRAEERSRHDDARADRERSVLVIVDIQEKLAPTVAGRAELIARSEALLAAARRFRIPCVLTEHCADRIGPVVAPLRERFDAREIFTKTRFAATDHPEFERLVRGHERTQVVIAGIEAHVCVLQTSLGLLERGFEVFVAGDAAGSRTTRQADRTFALERIARSGGTIAGTETILFEWTRTGHDAAFRDVLEIVKRLPE